MIGTIKYIVAYFIADCRSGRRKTEVKDIKKVCRLSLQTFNSLFVVRDYSATAAESAAVESAATAVESTAGAASSTVSTVVESAAASLLAALFPQEAKDTAAKATNKNTNFFIFFCF